jgi:nitroimidazol reductase NimA-like FMN-containing flavoprotein (pyridoxamine 5'-phosphate oxidase superfamily)
MTRGEEGAGHGLRPLDDDACWDLLPEARIGRLAWTDPDGRLLVVPVNFGIDGRTIVVRTGDTVLLDAATARARCAFQADDLEPGLRSGWTVLVDGRLGVVADPVTAERLGRLVDPWLRRPRPHVLLLEATGVSGRRLEEVGGVEVVSFDAAEQL